jgi:hypothetical protein
MSRRPDNHDRNLEDVLRRALRAAADSIEPGSDGIDQIRAKISARQDARRFSWHSRARHAMSTGHRGRGLVPAGTWLAAALRSLADRFRPEPGRSGWLGWMRPVAALATGLLVMAAASWAVAALPAAISPTNNARQLTSPAVTPAPASSGSTAGGASQPYDSVPTGPSCSPTAPVSGASPSPGPGGSASPSPSPSSSPTGTGGSPSPSPSGSGSPQPTDPDSASGQASPAASLADELAAQPRSSPRPTPAPDAGASGGQDSGSSPSPAPSASPSAAPSGSPAPGPCGPPAASPGPSPSPSPAQS